MIHNQLTEDDRVNYFHFLLRGDPMQPLKNFSSPTREDLAGTLAIFRGKNVKPQSMARAKHEIRKFVFNPADQKLVDLFDELPRLAKDAFGMAARAIFQQFIHAKIPPRLKNLTNQAHLEF